MSEHDSVDPSTPLTPWLGAEQRPAHAGVYARRAPAGPYACWDGTRWRGDAGSPAQAAREATPSRHQRAAWRGLARPSSQPCATCRGHGVVDRGLEPEHELDRIDECPDC